MNTPPIKRQKKVERRHLHSFRYLCKDFPGGEFIDSETPDFLVRTPTGRKIGIEHIQVSRKMARTKPLSRAMRRRKILSRQRRNDTLNAWDYHRLM